nr:MAG TPA: hypothetical protein [Caudoviricetes sp.]
MNKTLNLQNKKKSPQSRRSFNILHSYINEIARRSRR